MLNQPWELADSYVGMSGVFHATPAAFVPWDGYRQVAAFLLKDDVSVKECASTSGMTKARSRGRWQGDPQLGILQHCTKPQVPVGGWWDPEVLWLGSLFCLVGKLPCAWSNCGGHMECSDLLPTVVASNHFSSMAAPSLLSPLGPQIQNWMDGNFCCIWRIALKWEVVVSSCLCHLLTGWPHTYHPCAGIRVLLCKVKTLGCLKVDSHVTFPQARTRIPISLHPHQYLLFSTSWITVILGLWRGKLWFGAVSLIISDPEHLFMCLLASHISSLENNLFKSFTHFWIIWFFFLWVVGPLYSIYFYIESLIRCIICKNIFSHSMVFFPSLLIYCFFGAQKVLILMNTTLSIFSSIACAFCVIFKKPLLNPRL